MSLIISLWLRWLPQQPGWAAQFGTGMTAVGKARAPGPLFSSAEEGRVETGASSGFRWSLEEGEAAPLQ